MAKDKKKTSENAEASAVEETKSTTKAKTEDTKPAKKDKSDVSKDSKKGSKKDAKKDGEKKNIFKSIGKWFRDLRIEFKNVTWPSKNTVMINTSVVLFVIVFGSVIIGLLDTGLLRLMEFLIGLSNK